MAINVDNFSSFERSFYIAFEALMKQFGRKVEVNGVGYDAIRRNEDEFFEPGYGGMIVRTTMEFWADEAPAEDATITDGSETFRVEGLVGERPWSKRLAVSKLT